jgi:hypothetical protein
VLSAGSLEAAAAEEDLERDTELEKNWTTKRGGGALLVLAC